jgi:lysozyme family protein
MREDFNEAIEFVLEQEGGYTLDTNDPGGETKYGISKKAYPNLDIKNLTREAAVEIYCHDYWQPCKCDDLPRHFALIVFDSAVNQGPRVAIRLLQIALGVSVDGIIGPKTLAAASSATPKMIRLALAERLAAYSRLMAEKQNLLRYALNWSFRVLSLAKKVDV